MHPKYQNKLLEVFDRKAAEQQWQTQFFTKHIHVSDIILKALSEVALLIAKTKQTHIVGENFVLSTAIKTCEIVRGDLIADPLMLIPTSSDMIKMR
jgi:hypothetical protein